MEWLIGTLRNNGTELRHAIYLRTCIVGAVYLLGMVTKHTEGLVAV